ncbi:hypothetical protein GGR53DRAFT_144040 [Hypoxylon sp. FL1150]|nr:hypothetical protein GGR53DRAFT_144040 [Hypoxylon sp. FL1150]
MTFGILLILWTLLLRHCEADVRFTVGRWEAELGNPLLITWADANGPVNVNLVNATGRGPYEVVEVIGNYTGRTLTWTPRYDLGLDEFIFRISDERSVDESPRLSLSSQLLQNIVRRNTSDSHDESGGNNDGLPPGAAAGISVGSTLGGILLLALVAFFIFRGRKNRTRLEHQEAGERDTRKQKEKEPQVDMSRPFNEGTPST